MSTTVFDITAYGAVGDGVTVCTSEIQRALDDAAAVRGMVYVPPGVYKTGMLHVGAGTALRGESAWSYGRDGASTLSLCDASAVCLLDITGAFGCSVNGLCFAGGMLGNGIHGIMLRWDTYNGGGHEDTVLIDDCRVSQFSGDGLHFAKAWCFTVRHSHLAFNRGAGLYLDGWDAFLSDNWFSGNCDCGIRGGDVTSSITATGNRVEWNRRCGFLFRNGDSFNIGNNFFDRSCGPALVLGDGGYNDLWGQTHAENRVADAAVTGNVFRRSGKPMEEPFDDVYNSAHLRMSHSVNITVTGNVFKFGCDDGGGGVDSPEFDIVLDGNRHCIVRDNVMHEGCMTRSIIRLGEEQDMLVKDNLGDPVQHG